MNVLLICGKEMQKNLEVMCSRARNKRVIGTLTQVDDNIVELVKTTYRPHCIIWAQGIDFKTDTSELDLILSLQNEFPSTRIIVNHGRSDELTTALVENDIYDVVARVVTDIEFLDLLNTPLSSKEEFERFNRDTHKAKSATVKTHKKVVINNKPIFIFVAVIMLFTILFVLFVKNKQSDHKPTENATELSTAVATEYVTDYLVIDDRYEFPTEEETEEATEKATEETTEKPTEKPTEKKDKEDEEDKNEQDNNSNTSQTQVQQPQQQYVQQPAQEQQQTTSQVQQPVQEPQQSVPQVQQPVQEQQQSAPQVQQPVQQPEPIVDDGLIHFDKDSYTVKAGEIFDIYVTGLATSSGCKWELTNSAVAEFVSSDTTKVTIKAKAKGLTVVTGTAKSNGATRQVLVTVE